MKMTSSPYKLTMTPLWTLTTTLEGWRTTEDRALALAHSQSRVEMPRPPCLLFLRRLLDLKRGSPRQSSSLASPRLCPLLPWVHGPLRHKQRQGQTALPKLRSSSCTPLAPKFKQATFILWPVSSLNQRPTVLDLGVVLCLMPTDAQEMLGNVAHLSRFMHKRESMHLKPQLGWTLICETKSCRALLNPSVSSNLLSPALYPLAQALCSLHPDPECHEVRSRLQHPSRPRLAGAHYEIRRCLGLRLGTLATCSRKTIPQA